MRSVADQRHMVILDLSQPWLWLWLLVWQHQAITLTHCGTTWQLRSPSIWIEIIAACLDSPRPLHIPIIAQWFRMASENFDIIGLGIGLSPVQHQAIKWNNVDLSVESLGTNFACSAPSHYLNQYWLVSWTPRKKLQWNLNRYTMLFMKVQLKMSSAKWRPFRPWS